MSRWVVASFLVMVASLAKTGTLVQAAEWQVSTVLADLDSPRGVAVQPETDQVYVCDTGRGRVLRIADGKPVEVIVGLPVNRAAETPHGPMSLVFLDAKILLVGGGGLPDSEDGLYAFSVPDPGAPPVGFDDAIVIGPLPKSDQPAEGDFGNLSVSRLGILAASQGETAQGWISRLEIKDSEPPIRSESFGALSRFLDAGAAVPVRGAACVTVSPRGEIVVGHMGQRTHDGDSWLSLFRATDQKRLLTLETGLHDLVGLIYSSATSPVTDPQLYAIDAGGSRPEQGGLFRLDASLKEGRQAITPTKLASLQRPTAIARGPGNAFYVTLLGPDGTQDAIAKTGQLVRIALAP